MAYPQLNIKVGGPNYDRAAKLKDKLSRRRGGLVTWNELLGLLLDAYDRDQEAARRTEPI